jgi:hypothetical protein
LALDRHRLAYLCSLSNLQQKKLTKRSSTTSKY